MAMSAGYIPFDPNPSKPKFKPPPGAVDAHCHVFGPEAKFPYAPERKYTPCDAPKEKLFALRDFLGLDKNVIVQASCHSKDNRAMVDALTASNGRAKGVAFVGEEVTDDELKWMDRAGARGVRFNFVKHLGSAPDMAVFDRVIDRIKRRGWHVVLHVDAPDIIPLSDMIKKLPLPFVIDHMGRVPAKDGVQQAPLKALLELARRDNAWIKVCGSERIDFAPYDKAVPIARAIIETAPDRVLWGTDFPHPNPSHEADEADLVDLVSKFAPDAKRQQALLVDNPARLYGFE